MPHGVDDLDWDELVEATIDTLREVARQGRTTTYGELAKELGRVVPHVRVDPHYGPMPHLLEAINVVLRQRDPTAPMLSALVIRADSNDPGNGFYRAAERQGYTVGDRIEFWTGQVRACHEWADR